MPPTEILFGAMFCFASSRRCEALGPAGSGWRLLALLMRAAPALLHPPPGCILGSTSAAMCCQQRYSTKSHLPLTL